MHYLITFVFRFLSILSFCLQVNSTVDFNSDLEVFESNWNGPFCGIIENEQTASCNYTVEVPDEEIEDLDISTNVLEEHLSKTQLSLDETIDYSEGVMRKFAKSVTVLNDNLRMVSKKFTQAQNVFDNLTESVHQLNSSIEYAKILMSDFTTCYNSCSNLSYLFK